MWWMIAAAMAADPEPVPPVPALPEPALPGPALPHYDLAEMRKPLRIARTGLWLSIVGPVIPLATGAVGCSTKGEFACVSGLVVGGLFGIPLMLIGPPMLVLGSLTAAHIQREHGLDVDRGPGNVALALLGITSAGLLISPFKPVVGLPLVAGGYVGSVVCGGWQLERVGSARVAVIPMVGPDVRGVAYVVAF